MSTILDKLTALEAAATKRPWTANEFYVDAPELKSDLAACMVYGDERDHANASLIAAMRNHLPALLRLTREAVNVELDYIRTPNRLAFWEAREALLVEDRP